MADSKAGYSALPRTSTAPAVVHAGGPVVEAVAVPVVTDRVEVVAPASLPGNYQLHCDFQGRPVVVLVVRTLSSLLTRPHTCLGDRFLARFLVH